MSTKAAAKHKKKATQPLQEYKDSNNSLCLQNSCIRHQHTLQQILLGNRRSSLLEIYIDGKIIYANFFINVLLAQSQFGSPLFCCGSTIHSKFIEPGKRVSYIAVQRKIIQGLEFEAGEGSPSYGMMKHSQQIAEQELPKNQNTTTYLKLNNLR